METQPEHVTYLTPKQWEELQALIDEDRPPSTELLAAARRFADAVESGEIIRLD